MTIYEVIHSWFNDVELIYCGKESTLRGMCVHIIKAYFLDMDHESGTMTCEVADKQRNTYTFSSIDLEVSYAKTQSR